LIAMTKQRAGDQQNWTEADIPDQSGRTAVVTGANAGLGLQAARVLAARGAHVVLACRNLDRAGQAAKRIAAESPAAGPSVVRLDLASQSSVRAAAEEIRARFPQLDLLINNAGVMEVPCQRTEDCFELTLATNHLGPFALTGLLLDRLAAGARIVTVSSMAHLEGVMDFDDLQAERRYDPERAYAQSKLANLLFTYELQRRLAPHGTTIAVAAHPGGSRTELTRNLPPLVERIVTPLFGLISQDAATGALPTLRAATDPGVLGGQYYGPDGFGETRGYPKLVGSSAKSHDVDLQRRLWAVSEELTGVVYPFD
jgi:NAD(P)-dependent dehydrogenase (short-subunit alcohol dehydrogenase family)